MSESSVVNPEASHPLIAPLAEALRVDNIELRIRRSPLDGVDVAVLSHEVRHHLLDEMQEHLFEPTAMTLNLGTRLLRMIQRGYLSRDPRQLAVRKQAMAIAGHKGSKLSDLPWFDLYAKCMRVAGETGTGKTYEVLNTLRLLPRFVMHLENKEAGWSHFVQITWLYVSMSHDGSLGGLLLSILAAVDETIGTSYSTQSSLARMSNEKLAVHVGIILRIHAVGVLVIDEIQQRNFTGGHGELTALFFLRLLNFGIPLVLMGNPFGLSALDRFSQDVRRTGSAGSIDFEPCDVTDSDWTGCIAPSTWEYYVLPQPMTFADPDGVILFKYSGGIRDYACRVSSAAQRLALDLGDDALTVEHLKMAYQGADFSEKDRDLIEGFARRDPMRLMNFEDVRVQHYMKKWGLIAQMPAAGAPKQDDSEVAKETSSVEAADEQGNAPARPARTRHQQEVAAAKGLATRRANEAKRLAKAKEACGTDDIRNGGLTNFLLTGFDALRNVA